MLIKYLFSGQEETGILYEGNVELSRLWTRHTGPTSHLDRAEPNPQHGNWKKQSKVNRSPLTISNNQSMGFDVICLL